MNPRRGELMKGSLSPIDSVAPEMIATATLVVDSSGGSFTEITGGDLKDGDRVIVAALNTTSTTPSAASGSPGSQPGGGRGRGPGF